jgi:hypothetical protein
MQARQALLTSIFQRLDVDGSGGVAIEELEAGLVKTKLIASKLAAAELFHKVRYVAPVQLNPAHTPECILNGNVLAGRRTKTATT